MRGLLRLATCVALLLAAVPVRGADPARASDPPRVAILRSPHADPLDDEAATRLQAELLAAGFVVVLIDAAPGVDPRAELAPEAGPARAIAAVAIVHADHGSAADVWIADRASHQIVVRRVDAGDAAASSRPAALAIRTVELLRASLLDASLHASRPPAPAPAVAPTPAAAPDALSPPSPPAHGRALLAGTTFELGLSAVYGMGDTGGRLAPTLRVAYGAALGLAGRLTLIGPTATDQLGLIELAYGFDRTWRVLAPVVSLGAGAGHTHLTDGGGLGKQQLRTEAWAGLFTAGLGVAARAADRAAILFDVHAVLAEPTPGAIVGTAPAAGKAQLLVAASLGVIAGF